MFESKTKSSFRTLDFDIENMPLTYAGENPTIQITAIASCWTDDIGSMDVRVLGREDPVAILSAFIERYRQAGMVTGHFIRGHDLPIINGALIEAGMAQLEPKLTQDTYLDYPKHKGIPGSQEYLLALLGVGTKVHMTQFDWRQANKLLPEGLEKTIQRVTGDVYDHMRLRPEMLKRGLLKGPKIWHP